LPGVSSCYELCYLLRDLVALLWRLQRREIGTG
jgi:hypothetical protein